MHRCAITATVRGIVCARIEPICCGGIALQASGKLIPWRVLTISADGRILDWLMSENV